MSRPDNLKVEKCNKMFSWGDKDALFGINGTCSLDRHS